MAAPFLPTGSSQAASPTGVITRTKILRGDDLKRSMDESKLSIHELQSHPLVNSKLVTVSTVVAKGGTSVTVAHGLGRTPSGLMVVGGVSPVVLSEPGGDATPQMAVAVVFWPLLGAALPLANYVLLVF